MIITLLFRKKYAAVCLMGLIITLLLLGCNQHHTIGYGSSLGSAKAIAHSLQTMLETFIVDNKRAPRTLQELKYESLNHPLPYWKDTVNPCTEKATVPDSRISDTAIIRDYYKGIFITSPSNRDLLGFHWHLEGSHSGQVVYRYISGRDYRIYGFDCHNQVIKQEGKFWLLRP